MSDSTSDEVVLNMTTTANDAAIGFVGDEVGPDDSVSPTSRRSSRSRSDVGSSAGTKAAAVAAGLTAAVEHLEQLQVIEREEMALRQRRQALELGARLASANAERHVYERDESSSRASRRSARSHRNVEIEPVHVSVDSDAARAECGPDRHDRREPARGEHTNDQTLLDLVYRGQQQQVKIVNAMCLPKVELIPFDGDPLRYWLFSQQFDNNVDVNDVDERTKLLMLFQYCTGQARRAIECCAAMETSRGYRRARQLLKDRFGNDFVIAETWVNKVAGGPVIGGAG